MSLQTYLTAARNAAKQPGTVIARAREQAEEIRGDARYSPEYRVALVQEAFAGVPAAQHQARLASDQYLRQAQAEVGSLKRKAAESAKGDLLHEMALSRHLGTLRLRLSAGILQPHLLAEQVQEAIARGDKAYLQAVAEMLPEAQREFSKSFDTANLAAVNTLIAELPTHLAQFQTREEKAAAEAEASFNQAVAEVNAARYSDTVTANAVYGNTPYYAGQTDTEVFTTFAISNLARSGASIHMYPALSDEAVRVVDPLSLHNAMNGVAVER